MPRQAKPPVQNHALAACVALCALVILGGLGARNTLTTASVQTSVADIGVEHVGPLALTIEVGSFRNAAVVEITSHAEDETVFVSIPDTWEKRAVRNANPSTIKSEDPTFGFTRWHFPAGASISFGAPVDPNRMVVHNPTGVPLMVNVVRAELETETVIRDKILVHESSAEIY